jgi:hypothetical protein
MASLIGTVVAQGRSANAYIDQFGPFWFEVLDKFSIWHIYNSWWFLVTMAFLVLSTSLCLIRNAPKMLKDARSFREHIRASSLRSFHHKIEVDTAREPAQAAGSIQTWLQKQGYAVRQRADGDSVLLAAKRGSGNRFGYIFAHAAIVIICVGGLLDSELPIRLQVWLFGKTPIVENMMIADVPARGRLSVDNPSFRANVLYGTVSASDADANLALLVNRNLSFQSDIYEVAAGVEFSYFPFKLGSDRYKGTAYLLAEIGIFHMNPKAMYEGSLVELQPLGTEGQGSSLSSKRNYSLTQLSVPIGVGCKLSLGKRASLSLEYGIRKTFTDYLDDVKANTFVDRGTLAQENGAVAAALSNRNINNEAYGKRGNTATKDWYTFFGAMLTFRLGKPNVCPMNM